MAGRRVRGYWKDLENVKRELEPIVRDLGKVPSEKYLRSIRRQDIASGISKHHGMNKINQAFGFESKGDRKKLKSWDQFKAELEIVIDALDDFPTETSLREIGKAYLGRAARDYHGGMAQIRARLGFEGAKEHHYWHDDENILKETKSIIEKFDRLPSSSELQTLGYSSFVSAISTYYGGFNKLREDLGLDTYQVESGHWQEVNNLLEAYERIISTFNGLPTRQELTEKDYGGFLSAVDKYYGGLRAFAERFELDVVPEKKPNKYWSNIENVKRIFVEFINEHKHFPSYAELVVLKRSDLSTAASRHGGLRAIAKMLGYTTTLIADDGHHCDSFQEKIVDNNLFRHGIPHERGTTLHLGEINAVPDFILGSINIIEVLMIDYRKISDSKVQQYYAERYKLKKAAYKKHGFIVCEFFPSDFTQADRFSQRLNESIEGLDLDSAISPISSESINLMGLDTRVHPGYWRDIENVRTAIEPLCIHLGGRMPTYNEFIDRGLGNVYHGINNFHGNTREVGEILGYPIDDKVSHRARGYWKDNLDHVMSELKRLHQDLDRFPKAKEIQDYDNSLYYAICRYYGGLTKIKPQYMKLIGQALEKQESSTDSE